MAGGRRVRAELAPDGSSVLFVRDGQIFRARVTPTRPVTAIDRGEAPFIKAWGTNTAPRWSPDGRKIAFVSNRVDHSFIGIYDVATRSVKYMAPERRPRYESDVVADSRRIAFIRRPVCRSGNRASRAAAASECRTDLPSIRRRRPDAVPRRGAGRRRPAGWRPRRRRAVSRRPARCPA